MEKWLKPTTVLLVTVLLVAAISACDSNAIYESPSKEIVEEQTITFEYITHKRTEKSMRMYKALTADYNGVVYDIESSCVEDEESAKNLILSVDSDIQRVVEFFGELKLVTPKVTIFNINNQHGEELLYSYNEENMIATTIDFIASGEYFNALIGAMLDNDIPWVNHGLAGQFQNNAVDEDEIKVYLSENIDVLDFFGARYYKTVPENDWAHATEITKAFVDYYINVYGITSLIDYIRDDEKIDLVKEKNVWLDYLGLQEQYANDINIAFQNFEFSACSSYDFEINSPYAIYRIKMNDGENCVLSSLYNLKYFLTKNILAMDEVKAFLSNRISNKELIELDMIPLYDINEMGMSRRVYADPYDNIVKIHRATLETAHIHEYVHIITPINEEDMLDPEIDYEYSYFVEGIACYVTSSVNNEYSCNYTDFNTYETFNEYQVWTEKIYKNESDIIGSFNKQNQFFVTKYLEYYTSHAYDFIEFTDFNMKLYSDSYSYALLNLQEKYPSAQIKNYDYYALYESFVGYLADEYSLEQVMQALDDYHKVQEIFGKSFEELQSEWKQCLLSFRT